LKGGAGMMAVKTSEKRFWPYMMLFYLLAFFVLSGTASAHVEQWSEPGYNFKNVQKLLVYDLDTSAVDLESDIAEKNFQNDYWEQAKKQKMTVLTEQRAANQISLLEYKDIDQLREKDPTAAEAMWNTNLPRVVDAYAKMQYLKYEYTSRVIPAHTEWRSRYVRRTFYDRDGNKHEDLIPEEYPEFVPEKTIWTLHQQIRFDVYDAQTGKCIYSRNESRSDDYAGDGRDIFVKIVRNSFKDFVKKCQR
jgi:hypothetical protein